MTCSSVTDAHTHKQTKKTEAALSGLSELLTSTHHQGAVQNYIQTKLPRQVRNRVIFKKLFRIVTDIVYKYGVCLLALI